MPNDVELKEEESKLIFVKPYAKIMKMSSPTGEECLLNLEKIARLCYKSEDKITGKVDDAIFFFKRTIFRDKDKPHLSVIEHESVTVRFVCDRGISHEIVRHRLASFTQESTRYCNYSNDKFGNSISVINPAETFNWSTDKELVWMKGCEKAAETYFELIKMGCKPQEARSVLPNSLKTELVVTMNFREWLHFFKMRDDIAAHPQMRELASDLHKQFKERIPFIFD